MATIGQIGEINLEEEKILAYLKRIQLFFTTNSIAEDKLVAILLPVVGSKTYSLLDLLELTKPQSNKIVC